MNDIESFISRGNPTPEVEPEVELTSDCDIPDSYDPSLRFEELHVNSQSKVSGPMDELASFRKFGISRYHNCKYDSYCMSHKI